MRCGDSAVTAVPPMRLTSGFVALWCGRYLEEELSSREIDLLERVGPDMRRRSCASRQDLVEVVRWKSPRALRRLDANSDEDIADITRLAFAAPARLRHRVLLLLGGIGRPVASAVLTVWDPSAYTVLDFRAVGALFRLRELASPQVTDIEYGTYVELCLRLAESVRVSPRDLDRALWKWSKAGYPAAG